MKKPYRLRRWRLGQGPATTYFFSCARPGRELGKSVSPVPDDVVDKWVRGLPQPNTAIVSLLGRKRDGLSEYSFYSFCGAADDATERRGRPTFQEWLEQRHGDLQITVRYHPTRDFAKIPPETLAAIKTDLDLLFSQGRTVVFVDSGGETRNAEVCNFLSAVEDSSSVS